MRAVDRAADRDRAALHLRRRLGPEAPQHGAHAAEVRGAHRRPAGAHDRALQALPGRRAASSRTRSTRSCWWAARPARPRSSEIVRKRLRHGAQPRREPRRGHRHGRGHPDRHHRGRGQGAGAPRRHAAHARHRDARTARSRRSSSATARSPPARAASSPRSPTTRPRSRCTSCRARATWPRYNKSLARFELDQHPARAQGRAPDRGHASRSTSTASCRCRPRTRPPAAASRSSSTRRAASSQSELSPPGERDPRRASRPRRAARSRTRSSASSRASSPTPCARCRPSRASSPPTSRSGSWQRWSRAKKARGRAEPGRAEGAPRRDGEGGQPHRPGHAAAREPPPDGHSHAGRLLRDPRASAASATDQEIKSAYRKLALKYHPDRNPGDKDAEEQVQGGRRRPTASSATPEKRQRYDTFGHAGARRQRSRLRSHDLLGLRRHPGRPSSASATSSAAAARRPAPGADLRYNLELHASRRPRSGPETHIQIPRPATARPATAAAPRPGTQPTTLLGLRRRRPGDVPAGLLQRGPHLRRCRGTGRIVTSQCKECKGQGQVADRAEAADQDPAGRRHRQPAPHHRRRRAGRCGRPAGRPVRRRPASRSTTFFRRDGHEPGLRGPDQPRRRPRSAPRSRSRRSTAARPRCTVPEGTQPGTSVPPARPRRAPSRLARPRRPARRPCAWCVPTRLTAEQRQLLEQLAKTLPDAEPAREGPLVHRQDEGHPLVASLPREPRCARRRGRARRERSRLSADHHSLGPDSQPQAGSAKGRVEGLFTWKSTILDGTTREYLIHVPAGDPARLAGADGLPGRRGCVSVDQEYRAPVVSRQPDREAGDAPTLGVFVNPGHAGKARRPSTPGTPTTAAAERDRPGDQYALLPHRRAAAREVAKRHPFTKDPEGRAIAGVSSGAASARSRRPGSGRDFFRKSNT